MTVEESHHARIEPDLASSPVHVPGSRLRWTTANVDEGLPGVVTPLTWSLYFPPTESTMRDCWVDLGVMPESERAVPDDVDGRFLSVAFGRAIANVDLMGRMAARIPGGSAAQMEEQLFGSVQEGSSPEPRGWDKVGRYPQVVVGLPGTMRRAIRDFEPRTEEIRRFWEREAFGLADTDLGHATAVMLEARRLFESGLAVHMVLSMASQGLMGQVEKLAARAGLAGLESELIRSDEGTAEFDLVRDLWRLADREIDTEQFIRVHGFHGPREGLVESKVWREDPDAVSELAASYRARERKESVDDLVRRRREEHARAVDRLNANLGFLGRGVASRLLGFASRVPNWRETGRVNILRCVDVTRAASRAAGLRLREAGVLDHPDDVRFLGIDELVHLDRHDASRLIAARKADHAYFESHALPHVWRGVPEPTPVAIEAVPEVSVVTGLGVSGGIAEGIVRVITDLDDAEIEEGTVMVCRATDPSWASLFPLAEAVVTDVGSQMSHAAIVCRELGLPCVANTRHGTRALRDGMRVRVDGNAGTVEVLEP